MFNLHRFPGEENKLKFLLLNIPLLVLFHILFSRVPFCFLGFIFFFTGMQLLTIYQRFLASTSNTAPANQGESKSKTSENANSDEGSKSGESHESGDAGKSVRGGVIGTISFDIFFHLVNKKCN